MRTSMRVAIVGAGVAGAYLHALLGQRGIESRLYDVTQSYWKACGEAVTNSYAPRVPWRIVHQVKDFSFFLDGQLVYEATFNRPKWVIIDKAGWVNSMRKDAVIGRRPNPKEFDLVLDATGPYSLDREVVFAARAMVRPREQWEGVTFEFSSQAVGFYWVFPSGNGLVNVGAGFVGIRNPAPYVEEYARKRVGGEVLSLAGAPISIGPVKTRRRRIGEARGLVFPMAGEGIRPAAISAELAADAIYRGKDVDEYLDEGLKEVNRIIAGQRLALKAFRLAPSALRRALIGKLYRSDAFLEAYLSDEAEAWTALADLLRPRRPSATLSRCRKLSVGRRRG